MKTEKILVGTRKGLIVLSRKHGIWKIIDNHFHGIPISMVFQNSQTGRWWVGLDHGHWGCKMASSDDEGANWLERAAPMYPAEAKVKGGKPAALSYIWSFANVGKQNPEDIYIGTEPGGLFYWEEGKDPALVRSLWDDPSRLSAWFGAGRDHPGIHSIIVDERNRDHITVGISVAGVFQTRDGGLSWQPKNKGLVAEYLPDADSPVGHDPHLLVSCPSAPDIYWQQNHCGIFRSTDNCASWNEVSDENALAKFGFAIAVDPQNPQRAWVVPAVSDEIRVAHGGSLSVCRTDDGGQTWQRYHRGLPQEHCYDLVYRHALVSLGDQILFGSTTGNLFASEDGGESWMTISNYLPMVYCLAPIQ